MIHKKFNIHESHLGYDIGIIRLKYDIDEVFATAVPEQNWRPLDQLPANAHLRLYGYGMTEVGTIPDKLQVMTVEIVNSGPGIPKFCEPQLLVFCYRGNISGTAKDQYRPLSTLGDKGNPLLINYEHRLDIYVVTVGIHHGEFVNSQGEQISIAANVTYFKNWINHVTDDNLNFERPSGRNVIKCCNDIYD